MQIRNILMDEEKDVQPKIMIELALIRADVERIKSDTREIKTNQKTQYVTKEQFDGRVKPLEKLVYGMVALILIGVVGALLGLVILGGSIP